MIRGPPLRSGPSSFVGPAALLAAALLVGSPQLGQLPTEFSDLRIPSTSLTFHGAGAFTVRVQHLLLEFPDLLSQHLEFVTSRLELTHRGIGACVGSGRSATRGITLLPDGPEPFPVARGPPSLPIIRRTARWAGACGRPGRVRGPAPSGHHPCHVLRYRIDGQDLGADRVPDIGRHDQFAQLTPAGPTSQPTGRRSPQADTPLAEPLLVDVHQGGAQVRQQRRPPVRVQRSEHRGVGRWTRRTRGILGHYGCGGETGARSTRIASARPHQRQVTEPSCWSRISSSSTRLVPPRSKWWN